MTQLEKTAQEEMFENLLSEICTTYEKRGIPRQNFIKDMLIAPMLRTSSRMATTEEINKFYLEFSQSKFGSQLVELYPKDYILDEKGMVVGKR